MIRVNLGDIMNYIDYKYCGILSGRLARFKVKATSPYRANFRCPLCGDSQKSANKTRGWILEKENKAMFYCHNCGASHPLWRFLKVYDLNIYNEYVVDTRLEENSLRAQAPEAKTVEKQPPLDTSSFLSRIKKVSSLKADHPVKKYIEKRQIPPNQHYRIFYAPKFNSWVNSMIPDKLSSTYDEPRLVLPFLDEKGRMFGFAGRSFDPKANLRYITIMLEERPKIFGLDTVDFDKTYYVVEGQIDSMFLDNAVAMAGADGNTAGLKKLENAIFVFDNERRNREIVNRMSKVIDRGHKIVIWPENLLDKDINNMIMSGISKRDIHIG